MTAEDAMRIEVRAAPRGQGGFTLVELLVVMVILGLLAALVVPSYLGRERKARAQAAKTQIQLLGTALDTLRLDAGRYPSTREGLEALRTSPPGLSGWDGPYLKKAILRLFYPCNRWTTLLFW
jgi:general secretion pathway protein G